MYNRRYLRDFIIWRPEYHQNIQRILRTSARKWDAPSPKNKQTNQKKCLNACDFWSLRQHCIKNQHQSIKVQRRFRNIVSVRSSLLLLQMQVHTPNHKRQKPQKQPEIMPVSLGPSSSEMWKCVLWSDKRFWSCICCHPSQSTYFSGTSLKSNIVDCNSNYILACVR